jgi:hypothetical protein
LATIKTDTIGLQQFFETQRNLHTWKKEQYCNATIEKSNLDKALKEMKTR